MACFHGPRAGPKTIAAANGESATGSWRSLDTGQLKAKLFDLKKRAGRSWKTLRLACLEQLGQDVIFSTHSVARSSRQLACWITREVGMGARKILAWLDAEPLGQK